MNGSKKDSAAACNAALYSALSGFSISGESVSLKQNRTSKCYVSNKKVPYFFLSNNVTQVSKNF